MFMNFRGNFLSVCKWKNNFIFQIYEMNTVFRIECKKIHQSRKSNLQMSFAMSNSRSSYYVYQQSSHNNMTNIYQLMCTTKANSDINMIGITVTIVWVRNLPLSYLWTAWFCKLFRYSIHFHNTSWHLVLILNFLPKCFLYNHIRSKTCRKGTHRWTQILLEHLMQLFRCNIPF